MSLRYPPTFNHPVMPLGIGIKMLPTLESHVSLRNNM